MRTGLILPEWSFIPRASLPASHQWGGNNTLTKILEIVYEDDLQRSDNRAVWEFLSDCIREILSRHYGGGISRCCKCDDDLTILEVVYEDNGQIQFPDSVWGGVRYLLNGCGDVASTLTTGHHRGMNIVAPKGGHKEMGVLEIVYETESLPPLSIWMGGVLTAKRTGLCCGFQGCLHEHPCYIYKASVQDNGDSLWMQR